MQQHDRAISDFDHWMALSEKAEREAAIASDDAFVAALNKAIKRKREKVTPGTYVDETPPVGALRLRGSMPTSACGSAAAMCAEA